MVDFQRADHSARPCQFSPRKERGANRNCARPGQARTIWGDHERFQQTYFRAYPGLYFTGDGCRRDEDASNRRPQRAHYETRALVRHLTSTHLMHESLNRLFDTNPVRPC